MMKNILTSIALSTVLLTTTAFAKNATYLSIEEARIQQANDASPKMVSLFNKEINAFGSALNEVNSVSQLKQVIKHQASDLFSLATKQTQSTQSYDDRPLYWARLQMAKLLRGNEVYRGLAENEQAKLMFDYELASRGYGQAEFTQNTTKKILITGFDPFFLDRNITQSNPSGIAALMLNNKVIELNGETAEIQAFIVPVRFSDFDQGMIETLLSDYYDQVDMITTISMGREDFDLERFPALRRSAKAPGNLNIYTGATSTNPLKPFLNGVELQGPEFVEFSLPITAMQKAKGKYQVIDNHKIETLAKGKFEPKALDELNGEISVNGSGGGYLSNEISYRSILLRDQLKPTLPVGHIHTPRIKDWQQAEVKAIVEQIEAMLIQAIPAI
ncbi:pyroglutamyl-peptidase I family protein [Colwellia sp. MEBiC06753]